MTPNVIPCDRCSRFIVADDLVTAMMPRVHEVTQTSNYWRDASFQELYHDRCAPAEREDLRLVAKSTTLAELGL